MSAPTTAGATRTAALASLLAGIAGVADPSIGPDLKAIIVGCVALINVVHVAASHLSTMHSNAASVQLKAIGAQQTAMAFAAQQGSNVAVVAPPAPSDPATLTTP